ncbi:TRAP transporter small permease [Halomonas sp. THAF12]|uniref:TRAP transporter small permease n=1 Tax=Halomonas sp. THAF12 TaxID=2587849 RepID=UPI001562CB45|nr:TRAP transporter small permease [Halomonas sp. THAF12]
MVVVIFSAIMVLMFFQVINRYILGWSAFWTEEVVRMLLVWLVMLGTPVVVYLHEEIKVDLFSMKSARLLRAQSLLVTAISMLFCAALAYWGYLFALRSLGTMQPSLGISRAWLYIPIPLGSVMTVLALLLRGHKRSADEPTEVGHDDLNVPAMEKEK